MAVKLDVKDKKILAELDRNSRQSFGQIAKKVGLSKNVVAYRVKRLEDKNVILNYFPALNLYKLGYMHFNLFVKFHNVTPEKEQEMIDHLCAIKQVKWVETHNGKWDLSVEIATPDMLDLFNIYTDFASKFSNHINDKGLSIKREEISLYNRWLIDSDEIKFTSRIADTERIEIDDKDLAIIKLLRENARMKTINIAQKVNMTAKSVQTRIKKLMDKGLITSFKVHLNHKLLDLQSFRIFLTLRDFHMDKRRELASHIMSYKETTYLYKSIGEAELEFEIIVQNYQEAYEFVKRIQGKFNQTIARFRIDVICKEHKALYSI